ncbi:hypothetical protein [Streptomyces sp. FXJ1.172]|uniref:hypothetical protein n=1 Tax=Streptomyces sp. FXJ1.172 TaxID=710705 RepID=UPI003FA7AE3C
MIKVADLAWLEFEKPDLDRAEVFARDFGFAIAARTEEALWLRGTFAGPPCMVVRRGHASRFVGPAFRADERTDLDRLAAATGNTVRDINVPGGGKSVSLLDPSGLPVRVVHCGEQLPALPEQKPLILNFGTDHRRTNATQRPPREPSRIQRLGHVVLETRSFMRTLDWYLDTLGMIVSDFLFLDGQRQRGPTMAFIRCDQGSVPVDHHTLAMAKLGIEPSAHDLSAVRVIGCTGSALPASAYPWVRDHVGEGIQLASTSGGTDVVSGFAGSAPTTPVWAGELSAPNLGVALAAYDSEGTPVRDQVGELVVTRPMPSMPLYFWNDPDGSRYRDAYFGAYPGVWRHGDWITHTSHGSLIVHGRSDATLARSGMGGRWGRGTTAVSRPAARPAAAQRSTSPRSARASTRPAQYPTSRRQSPTIRSG